MNEHTPGPWTIDRTLSERTVIGSCTEVVAVIPSPKIHGRGLVDVSERIANAHLISAAPDLLEALEAVAEQSTMPNSVYEQMLAAIAKARQS